jgi:Icc protein
MNNEIDFRGADGDRIQRVVWSTDLHLDAVDKVQYALYFDLMVAYEPDIVLIGGDVSNGKASLVHLQNLAKFINRELYFVLGNHDFYYDSITKMRTAAKYLTKIVPNIYYLSNSGIISLSRKTALIGHDGWSDGRAGNFLESDVMLNDYLLIDELKKLNHEERLYKLNELGSEAAEYLKKQLTKALKTYDRVILLTHVPPFEEACFHDGNPCDERWAPHFVGKATGEAIEKVMSLHPEKQLLVLCGHSHWGNNIQILPNLRVVTGHSELGVPNIQGLIFIN